MARSVSDPEALRTQLIELVTALGGPGVITRREVRGS